MERPGYKLKFAASTLLAASALGLLVWRTREPQTEPNHRECPEAPLSEPRPARGDGRCELDKAEADPRSANWDPESCGYCGDGIAQEWEQPSWASRIEQRKFVCDVDFHCGNGVEDHDQPYEALVRRDGGVFEFGTISITETCADCSRDCVEPAPRRTRRVREPEPVPISVPASLWSCPTQVATDESRDVVSAQSPTVQSVIRRITGAISGRARELRSALGVNETTEVDVRFSILVSESGVLTLQSASASCGGVRCGDHTTIVSSSRLSLNGLTLGSPGERCNWVLTVRVP
ncbi:MAG: hypothetical protein AB1529_02475 [Candidatus Micrarchaeota archaeon]